MPRDLLYQHTTPKKTRKEKSKEKKIEILGFVPNETLTYMVGVNPVQGTIESVEGPELDLFSGELLYIKGLTQEISRIVEQTDVFRFTFEF